MMHFAPRVALPLALAAIALSDTVGGLCARIALAMPLYWSGLIDFDTAHTLANPYGR